MRETKKKNWNWLVGGAVKCGGVVIFFGGGLEGGSDGLAVLGMGLRAWGVCWAKGGRHLCDSGGDGGASRGCAVVGSDGWEGSSDGF